MVWLRGASASVTSPTQPAVPGGRIAVWAWLLRRYGENSDAFSVSPAYRQGTWLRSEAVRNFFKGLSVTQLSAGALAAVASFLLSAKIGIAGSVIGVAVGSVVSAVVSQIYQNVVKASSEKLQNVAPFRNPGGVGGDEAAEGDATGTGAQTVSMTAVMPACGESREATRVLPVSSAGRGTVGRTVRGTSSANIRTGVRSGESGRVTAAHAGGARSSGRQTGGGRAAIAVAVLSALAAVGVTAGIILAVTQGQGTDSVVRDWVDSSHVEQRPAPGHDGTDGKDPSDGAAVEGDTTDDAGSDGSVSSPDVQDDEQSGVAGETQGGTSNGGVGDKADTSDATGGSDGAASGDNAGGGTDDGGDPSSDASTGLGGANGTGANGTGATEDGSHAADSGTTGATTGAQMGAQTGDAQP